MRYINRDPLDIPVQYTDQLQSFIVDIRGHLQREDIYFNRMDLKRLKTLDLSGMAYTRDREYIVWMETDMGKVEYVCYEGLLVQAECDSDSRINQFIVLVNHMLDNILVDPFADRLSDCSNHLSDDGYSLIDVDYSGRVVSDGNGLHTYEINQYLMLNYQHKIDLLTQILKTKNSEIQVMQRELVIMNLRMGVKLDKKNATIRELQYRLSLADYQSEWV